MKKPSRIRRILRALVRLVGACVVGTAVLVLIGLQDDLGHADAALVLGSKVELDGKPSARLQARLDQTLELYKAGHFPKIITSGGVGIEGFDEAAVMRDYLVTRGVPAESIIVDSIGLTTFASAQNTLQIARQQGFKSILVVSQYFHVPRAKMALQRFGIAPVYTAHARIFELRDIYSSFREFFGYLSYLFRRYDAEVALTSGP